MSLLALVFVAQLVSSLCFLAGTGLCARALGVATERLQLGFGPAIMKRKIGSVTYAFGMFPLGSYVQFERPDAPEDAPEDAEPPPDAFERASRVRRLTIALTGLLSMALIPLVWFGPIDGAIHIWRGIPQLVGGAISPFGTARGLIEAADALPALTLMPIFMAKIAAYQILPLPATNLWTILRVLLGGGWQRSVIGPLVTVLFGGVWLVAVVSWLFA